MNIKTLREQKHLTQEELASESGLSIRTIQRIESGQEPKGHTAKALSKVLGVDITVLTGTEIEEDPINYSKAKLINLSSLLVAFIPVVNFLVPLSIMYFGKQFNRLTKQILSLQILWAIIAIVVFLLLGFFRMRLSFSFRISQWIMIVFALGNVLMILVNTASIDRNKKLFFKINFSFI